MKLKSLRLAVGASAVGNVKSLSLSAERLEAIAMSLGVIESHLSRIADHFDPPPPDKVGTPYVAERLGCTTDWVAVMVREGEIPPSCVVPGTGNGKPWRFLRTRIDEWIENR